MSEPKEFRGWAIFDPDGTLIPHTTANRKGDSWIQFHAFGTRIEHLIEEGYSVRPVIVTESGAQP